MDARVHIFVATALGRGMVANPTPLPVFISGKAPVLIIQEAECPGPVWARRSEEKSAPLRQPGIEPGPLIIKIVNLKVKISTTAF